MTADTLFSLAPLVILFPLLGFVFNLVAGRRISERGAGIVASAAVGLAFVIAILQFVALGLDPAGATIHIAEWIAIGELEVDWALQIDTLSVTMLLMVTGVGGLIHIYAIGYMHDDVRFQGDPSRFPRFFVYFSLFMTAMLILVTGNSYLTMFVGWEGVGLSSYLLISFWYEKGENGIGNALAGKKAFIVNRVGDLGFIIAMLITFWFFGTLTFEEVFSEAEAMGAAAVTAATAITLFLFVGAAGKSAQIPLFVWLPDAMAGPTPVSALIHAATMVTAGIYMLVRNAPLLELATVTPNVIAIVGAATALLAASIAVARFDIKRVLAYSTISQLGFMIAAVGIGAYVAAIFHLVAHAFFKALLFLSAGSVIQGVEHGHHHADSAEEDFNPNDMRVMGGLRTRMKVTFWVYLIGALALAGIPPLAGFFSKDEILADASHVNPAVYWVLVLAAFLTAFYMGRQVLMVFFGKPRSKAAEATKESPATMVAPLVALAVLAVGGGLINAPGLLPLTRFLQETLAGIEEPEFIAAIAILTTLLALASIGLAWLLYGRRPIKSRAPDPLQSRLGPVWIAIRHRWWVDEFYDWLIVRRYVSMARWLAEVADERFLHDWVHDRVIALGYVRATHWLASVLDLRFIDRGFDGLGALTRRGASGLGVLQTGYVRNYAAAVFIGLVLVVSYLLLS
ncbi:MAG: NADH-quinone oxidoreductase subunit L [Chloroflexi bacterium]|nr:NADH-quinone oxidoreductase subunit L [Chloroflexota bacterium]MDK1044141.1 NADH-quinone oxidoreductase subunit L [Anaerolineales bacterium]MCH8877206.1 NADH-quinone oxidoreductase subunit L [Chloroflexota bacterium]MCI0772990.1 NADH-quinone oxidoreductase subunit L [Chloroflexota bacterium]MCI0806770.1 NADH-quinone oxidoreductase subunit L [Chloroflexota bacterium]